jgi:HEAT repeat protein
MGRWSVRVTLLLIVAVTFGAGPARADEIDAAVRHLRKAVMRQRDGSHLPMLYALRQLRDPTLRPLFHQMVQHEDWQVQVHAILGLAEIEAEGQVDPWLITQILPIARERAVAEALDMGLLDTSSIQTLLAWEGLEPQPKLLLLGELHTLDQPFDAAQLQPLTRHGDMQIAGFAAALLAEHGDVSAFEQHVVRVAQQSRNRRIEQLIWLFDVVRQYELRSLVPWIVEQVEAEDPAADSTVAYWGTFAALQFDPERGMTLWRRNYGSEPSHSKTVRYALLLLRTEPPLPAPAYARLPDGDDFIDAMRGAGEARAREGDPTAALRALLDFGHLKTSGWVMEVAEKLPSEQAMSVYVHLLDEMAAAPSDQSDRVELAVRATSQMFEIDEQIIVERLRAAEDDSVVQQAMLLGLFETRSPVAGEAAGRLRRIGSGQADSLALLLMAKHADVLAPDLLPQLGLIAAGGGRVSTVVQMQAAWLYVKHTGSIDAVLARIFADA